MGLWKQIKASRRATALGLDGYMLWEEPLACRYCKNTKWKVLRGLSDFVAAHSFTCPPSESPDV